MDIFKNINLLHVFAFILIIVGLLLIITAFTAYSNINEDCTSSTLRDKLRNAIIIGTIFVTISIGYILCVIKRGCKCSFGTKSDWKIYLMLMLLMGMGSGLLSLTLSIKNEANIL